MPASAFCVACSDLLGVAGAGLSLTSRRGSLDLVGVSGDVARLVEQVETAVGEGPCMTAFRREEPVFAHDLREEECPWPEFRRRALTVGIRAAFGFPLRNETSCIGALNIYCALPGALTDEQIATSLLLATFMGRTVSAWRYGAELAALTSELELVPHVRDLVQRAIALVVTQLAVSSEDALVLLGAYAVDRGRLVADVAADVVAGRVRFD
jgi:GAF domain-containing protein